MGTTRTVRTLVDGSMVIQIEVDPRHARDAFMLLGTPGTPVALARITPEAATAEARKEFQPAPAKGGALCKLAGMWSNDPEFHAFLAHTMKWAKSYTEPVTAEVAANIIRETCGVASRADLDHDSAAAELFHQNFRIPFQKWNQGARP
jgi:hypothetical protein